MYKSFDWLYIHCSKHKTGLANRVHLDWRANRVFVQTCPGKNSKGTTIRVANSNDIDLDHFAPADATFKSLTASLLIAKIILNQDEVALIELAPLQKQVSFIWEKRIYGTMQTNLLMCSSAPSEVRSFLDTPIFTSVGEQLQSVTPSTRSHKRSKPPPLRIDTETRCRPPLNPLAEFAAIATSPQSPLVKQMTCDERFYDIALRGQQPLELTPTFPVASTQNSRLLDSACSSPYSPANIDRFSSGDDSDLSPCGNSSYPWPTSIWQRLKQKTSMPYDDLSYRGTATSFSGSAAISSACEQAGATLETRKLSNEKQRTSSLFRPHYMKDDDKSELATESFTPESNSHTKDTPWSPFYPDRALSCHGIPRELFLGDICIPFSRSDEVATPPTEVEVPPIPEAKTSMLFDLDSAAHALSSMAKRKEEYDKYHREVTSNLQIMKRKPGSRMRKKRNEALHAKRPMNAFMLFAKRYRVEITQKHPGKDNRAISVILGDQWKSLSYEDRKTYIVEAKLLADEHKRINPDCWKRKRSTQVHSTTSRKC